MSLGACGGETSEEPKNPSTDTSASGGGTKTPSLGGAGGKTALKTTDGTIAMDYGVIAPTGGTHARTTTKSGTGGQTALKTTRGTIAMDYGVIEPTGGATACSSTRSGTVGITAHPDYGVISPRGGSSATSAQQSSTSSVDCSNVCCECDSGVPPEGCCECDSGVPPEGLLIAVGPTSVFNRNQQSAAVADGIPSTTAARASHLRAR